MTAKVIVKFRHDRGTIKISTWASSIDAAIEQVLRAENAPRSAVIYAKVSQLSIYDIKRIHEEKQRPALYFSLKTMRYFGQKVSDFKVKRHGVDKFYISAKSKDGVSERIFDPFTGKLELI